MNIKRNSTEIQKRWADKGEGNEVRDYFLESVPELIMFIIDALKSVELHQPIRNVDQVGEIAEDDKSTIPYEIASDVQVQGLVDTLLGAAISIEEIEEELERKLQYFNQKKSSSEITIQLAEELGALIKFLGSFKRLKFVTMFGDLLPFNFVEEMELLLEIQESVLNSLSSIDAGKFDKDTKFSTLH